MKNRYAILIDNIWLKCSVDQYYAWKGVKKKW